MYSLQSKIRGVTDDLEKRIKKYLNNHDSSEIKLPEYDKIKDIKEFYRVYNKLMDMLDEIIYLTVRIDLVVIQLSDIKKEKMKADSTNVHSSIRDFSDWLDRKIDNFNRYKESVGDVKRVIETRVKFMNSLLFRPEF